MKRFGMMLALSATMCGGAFAAEKILELSEVEDFSKPVKIVETDGENVFETAPGFLISNKAFEVNQEKTYLIKGLFRTLSQESTKVHLGFIPLDSDYRLISPQHAYHAPKTETELVEAVEIGDTIIKLKDGTNWKERKVPWFIAFNTRDDFSDLPNRDVSPALKSVNDNEVTLAKPIRKAYPVGTKVRGHVSSLTYHYVATNRTINNQWQEISGKIQGGKWRVGTAKAQILIWPLGNPQEKIQFKDISVEIKD